MSKFLGLPSLTTIAESNPPRLLPSVGVPKASEIAANISTFFNPASQRPKVGHCLMLDGLHLCHRCRWHRPTNQIIRLCREHSGDLDLSMNSMDSVLEVLEAVHGDLPSCHYGREATVAAIAPFCTENYHALPILQTQTCKSEKGPAFASLLEQTMEQWELHGEAKNGPLWVVSTDGDRVFGEGCFKLLMCEEVEESSPLGQKLHGLKGLNLQCGKKKVIKAPDPKHVVKRVGTTMRGAEGVVCDRVILNRAIITQWLERLPTETKESVAILVDPADHQNVPRAYKLIRACISLGDPSPDPSPAVDPSDDSTRRAFALAGEVWRAFLDPFTKGTMSLSEALTDLSEFAHLAFYFYRMHGSSFLSNQLYGDLQAIVKAAFFCVAQQQNLDPEQAFYLYQLGSDRLEELFAEVRTESHDSNVDALQLSERLSSAADSVGIWNEHPEWHQGHVRRSWSGKEADHVNPTFFTGDMCVGHVLPRNCWVAGEHKASTFLAQFGIDFDFDLTLSDPDVDFLRPNGNNVYPGNARDNDRSIPDDKLNSSDSNSGSLPFEDPESTDIQPFLPEDDAPTVFLEDFLTDSASVAINVTRNDWLDYPLENGGTKRLHKASILSTLFNSDFRRLATTRLLRVRCYTAEGHKPTFNPPEISGEHSFNVGDLAVALIRSNNTVAAAVVRAVVVEKNKLRVGQVDLEDLGSAASTVLVTAQPLIMRDIYVVGTHGVPSTRKWVWTGDYAKFEPLNGVASTVESGTRKMLTVKIPGALFHPLDAEVESVDVLASADNETMRGKNLTHTWSVANNDLMAVFSAMYESLDVAALLQLIPKHGTSDTFPYVRYNGIPALILENATQSLAQKKHDDSQKVSCFQCHLLIKPEDARAHVSVHILRAMCNVREPDLHEQVALPNPCGFCGRTGCGVEITKAGKSFRITSTCFRQHAFAYGFAKKYSTNVPIACELCDIVAPRKTHPAFWKYSLPSHIQSVHPRYWDDIGGVPQNLPPEFANKIVIPREELVAFGIAMGLADAPSAQSLAPASRGSKQPFSNVTNADAGPSNSSKRPCPRPVR
ncbi:hypothetical protein C8F04DRAFT_947209 [Mycena alexandri]|uniref:Uncharacterized protein n=1 Tax=Mycena alexandri TaxID=1745969 RepID=A0AAD6T8P3_9AGAR|nr:hypothetical protein C8F04DRAFT_947209 [Mycena alexandri]